MDLSSCWMLYTIEKNVRIFKEREKTHIRWPGKARGSKKKKTEENELHSC